MKKVKVVQRYVLIEVNYLEHLLNCLANQKFINELEPSTKQEFQKAIDDAWNRGMEMLSGKDDGKTSAILPLQLSIHGIPTGIVFNTKEGLKKLK